MLIDYFLRRFSTLSLSTVRLTPLVNFFAHGAVYPSVALWPRQFEYTIGYQIRRTRIALKEDEGCSEKKENLLLSSLIGYVVN